MVAIGGGRGVDVIHSCLIRPPPSRRSHAPNPLPSKDVNPKGLQIKHTPLHSKAPRRDTLLLLALPALLPSLTDSSSASSAAAAAFSLGIPGPKDWLRDQKKKAARLLMAALEAGSPVEDSGEVRRLLNLAAKDCVPQRRSSLVEFQSRTRVEV